MRRGRFGTGHGAPMNQALAPIDPDMAMSHPAILNRLPAGLAWHLSHKQRKCRVNTLRELAAWGRPKAGQWRGYGVVKLAALDSLIREAGLEWEREAPAYPRGNPMYEALPQEEEKTDEDIVERMRIALKRDWMLRFPVDQRNILTLAIQEILDLRAALKEAKQEVSAWEAADESADD